MSEDLAHDAHLRAALRHAPDHALSPPSGLSQTILAAARKAHRPPRPAPAPPPVRMRAAGGGSLAWLQRLSSPRWAGALATGLLAALGLGLWLDLGNEPVIEGPAVSVASDTQRAAAADAVPSPAVVAPPPVDALARDPSVAAKTMHAQSAAPPQRSDAPSAGTGRDAMATVERNKIDDALHSQRDSSGTTQHRAAQAAAESESRRRATSPASAQPAVRSQGVAAGSSGAETRVAAPTTAPAPEPVPAPPAALAKEQSTRIAEIDSAVSRAASPAVASELRTTLAPRSSRKAEADAQSASPARALLRRAQTEIASDSARWTWIAPGSTDAAPLDAAAQAWLERMAQHSEGRWRDAADRAEPLAAIEVHWWRDGRLQATLRIEADALRWVEPGAGVRRAALDADTLQRLRRF